jgi:hypothetical protein
MEKTRWSERLFASWVCVCLCWAGTACVISHTCPSFGHADRTFRLVGKTPEEDAAIRAWHDTIDRCESRLTFLAYSSLELALIGVLAFFRRGCAVFLLAAALVFVCYVALIAIYPGL